MTRSTLDTGWTNSHENEPDNRIVSSRVAEQPCGYGPYRNHTCVRPAGHDGEHSTNAERPELGMRWGTDPDALLLVRACICADPEFCKKPIPGRVCKRLVGGRR